MISLTQLFSQQVIPQLKSGSTDMSAMNIASTSSSEFREIHVETGSRDFKPERFETELYNAYEANQSYEASQRAQLQSATHEQNNTGLQAEQPVEQQVRSNASEVREQTTTGTTTNSVEEAQQNMSNKHAADKQGTPTEKVTKEEAAHTLKKNTDAVAETKLEELEAAIDDIKKSITDIKKEIVALFKKMGIDIDPENLSKDQMMALQGALKTFMKGSDADGEVQMNELIHALTDLGIAVDVAPMNIIEFDISGKKEISYLGNMPEAVGEKLTALLEQFTALSKKLDVMNNKKSELQSLRLDGFLPASKEDQLELKNGIIEKIKEVFTKEPQQASESKTVKHAVKGEGAEVTTKSSDVKSDAPKGQVNNQATNQNNFTDNSENRQNQNKNKNGEHGPQLSKAQQVAGQQALNQQAAQGAEAKTTETVQVAHSVKVDGERVTIEQTKQTAQSKGAQQTHVVRQVVKNVTLMVDSGKTTMNMQLKPEHLGRVNLNLQIEDSKMRLSLKVETEGAKVIVENSMVQLKDSLAAQGITVEDIDVSVGKDGAFGSLKEQQEEQQKLFRGRNRLKDELTLEVDINKDGAETGRRLGYNTMEYVA